MYRHHPTRDIVRSGCSAAHAGLSPLASAERLRFMRTALKKRLLLVEDHESSREAVSSILGRMNYDVVQAATLAEGLDSLDPPPDCVLLDLVLPDGPGEAILERIQAEQLPSRVVVCTGDHDEKRLNKVRHMHPAALLFKPISLAELVRAFR